MILNSFEELNSLNIHYKLFLEECMSRGVTINCLNPLQKRNKLFKLTLADHIEYFSYAGNSFISSLTDYCCKNKYLTKQFLSKHNISVPQGEIFQVGELEAMRNFMQEIGFPVVVKRPDSFGGKGVFPGIQTVAEAQSILENNFQTNETVLIESNFTGQDFRFFVIGERVIAVAHRIPAYIVGDGIHNIAELIVRKFPVNKLEPYFISSILREKAFDKTTVLPLGEMLSVSKVCNHSRGGEAVDVTEEVSEEFKNIAIKALHSIPNAPYGGIDIMSNVPISESPAAGDYTVIEINVWPGLNIHHNPNQGRSHKVASELVDLFFPESK